MEDAYCFRADLFDQLKDPFLYELSESDYESKIFTYLDSVGAHTNYTHLESFSKKLEDLKELEWLNSSRPLSIRDDLKGKLVLIDFWTYCCINCMHVIPILNQLEQKFKELVVIGVHSSKFTNEKSKSNISYAMKRHLIKHPVVCDVNLDIWNSLQIICWPTLLVVNPDGIIIGEFQGETQANLVQRFIGACFKYYEQSLSPTKLSFSQLTEDNTLKKKSDLNRLRFPTKIMIDGDSMFISDSGNNRIVVVDTLSNKVLYTIGSGRCGWKDSDFDTAQFDWPQGLAFDAETNVLYIADTFNDVIRAADLSKRTVTTVCGVCNKGLKAIGEYDFVGGKKALSQIISSPWDLCLLEKDKSKILLIACAGTHQIWLYSFENKQHQEKNATTGLVWWKNLRIEWDTLVCIAGNGKERNKNNSYPMQASFAQPSGLSYDQAGQLVYIADAESSTIRMLSLKDGSVKNVVGGDNLQPDNLFAYGDVDGKGATAKLQHPLDVKFCRLGQEDSLVVADSYNHALKIVNLKTKNCRKVNLSADVALNEPNSVYIDTKSRLWIADSNKHEIKIIESFHGNEDDGRFQANRFNIEFTDGSCGSDEVDSNRSNLMKGVCLRLDEIDVNFDAPNVWKLILRTIRNERFEYDGVLDKARMIGEHDYNLMASDLPVEAVESIELELNVIHCEKSSGVCKMLRKELKFDKEQLKILREDRYTEQIFLKLN